MFPLQVCFVHILHGEGAVVPIQACQGLRGAAAVQLWGGGGMMLTMAASVLVVQFHRGVNLANLVLSC